MPDRQIYAQLVQGPTDLVGALAYSYFKQSEVEWHADFEDRHPGVSPTPEQVDAFITACQLPSHIAGLKQRAESYLAGVLDAGVQQKLNELALNVAQSELAAKFVSTQTSVNSNVERIEKKLDAAVDRIEFKLDERKTWRAWGKDIVTAAISGLAVILAIGLLFNGYARLAAINSRAEKQVGIDLDAQKKLEALPQKPPAGSANSEPSRR